MGTPIPGKMVKVYQLHYRYSHFAGETQTKKGKIICQSAGKPGFEHKCISIQIFPSQPPFARERFKEDVELELLIEVKQEFLVLNKLREWSEGATGARMQERVCVL